MTRQAQTDEERFYASEYLARRGIRGSIEDSERPDFLVHTSAGIVGVEVISYGANSGRQVDAAWEELVEYSSKFRETNTDLSRFGVRLNFLSYRMPPRKSFGAFCEAVAARLRQNVDLAARGEWRTLHIDEASDPLLAAYLSQIEIYGVTCYSDWQWPALMNGGIGTSDEELQGVIARKLRSYTAPAGVDESHLVIVGRGPARTRIIAPFSAEHLEDFSELNSALREGPFAAAAILCIRDFFWMKAEGWRDLPKQ
jgi:hypothetical protein